MAHFLIILISDLIILTLLLLLFYDNLITLTVELSYFMYNLIHLFLILVTVNSVFQVLNSWS